MRDIETIANIAQVQSYKVVAATDRIWEYGQDTIVITKEGVGVHKYHNILRCLPIETIFWLEPTISKKETVESPTTADASVLKEALEKIATCNYLNASEDDDVDGQMMKTAQMALREYKAAAPVQNGKNMHGADIPKGCSLDFYCNYPKCSCSAQYNALPGSQEPWKSVEKDGYPEYNRGLLVCIPGEDYHITSGMWDISKKWVLLDEYREPECPVSHYMLLPKLPKEFEKEVSDNDAVMEHLSKLLKMGKIKKPDQSPSTIEESGLKEGEEEQRLLFEWVAGFISHRKEEGLSFNEMTSILISKYHITKKP